MNPTIAQYIFSNRSIAYAITDLSLKVEQIGGSVEILFGQGNQLIVDGEAPESLYEVSPELFGYEEELQAILDGHSEHHQLSLINRETEDGELRYILLQSFPMKNKADEITGLVHVVEDVSELGQLRQRLMQHRNELILLSTQLTERNHTLDAANTELKQLDEMKTRFVSTAAHELRTPLSTISGYTEILLEPDYEPLTDNQLRCLQIVERNTKRLIRITDDLLDVSSLEAGRIELLLRPVDFSMLVDMIVKDHQPLVQSKQQNLEVTIESDLPKALCDESRTMQILSNLVSNAIKYTPNEGKIQLRLEMANTEGFLQFSVADNGIGIPEKDKPQLFDSLVRASNVYQSGASGVGLGLYLVQSLIDLHGGKVWFESEEGQGTTFYVTFPIDDGLFG